MMSLVRCQSPRSCARWKEQCAYVSPPERFQLDEATRTDLGSLETVIMPAVQIGENPVLVFQTTVPPDWWVSNGGETA
jgi:hypothetical protein